MQSTKTANGSGTDAISLTVEQCQREYAGMSTGVLKAELLKLMNFSVENLIRMASIVAELDGRGILLGGMNISIMPMLRSIAKGNLLPDIVIKFNGEYDKIKKASKLPLDRQRLLLTGDEEIPEPARRGRSTLPPLPQGGSVAAPPKPLTGMAQQIADTKLPPMKENPRETAKSYWLSMSSHPNKRLVLNHFFRCLIDSEEVTGELAKLMRQFSVQI